ncbi:MAG: hypothetical protein MZV64_02955 [Ignavibacteriales bacterium]|nr:hypothetical protein [Ignavibacteriales bacterium]
MLMLDLGYIKLGQPSNTLSGGEAQRVKLAAHLSVQRDRTTHAISFLMNRQPDFTLMIFQNC